MQLQGNESPELCDDLSSQAEVIKVFGIDESVKDIDTLVANYDGVCDYYLFESTLQRFLVFFQPQEHPLIQQLPHP